MNVRSISMKTYCQKCINEGNLEGIKWFEFKKAINMHPTPHSDTFLLDSLFCDFVPMCESRKLLFV